MATMDDILGNGGGTPPPKGSKEWHELQQDAPSVSSPAKGTQKWTEQQAAAAPAVTGSQSETVAVPPAKRKDAPPTNGEIPVNHGKVVREFGDGVHAFMEDGTIRTSGFAGYTYSTPENMSNIDLFKVLNPYTPPTAEELEKEKKKQKRDQIFAAIGDGISALSNLFFTTQYAPNMYTGKNTMSERTKVRYDKLMKEREGKEKEYYEGLMKAKIADEEGDDRERKWQRLLRLDDYNRMRNNAKEERDRQLFELNLQLQGNKISASEADAKRKGIEAKYAEELEKAKVDTEKARGGAQRASASASRARANYYNEGGGSGNKYYGNLGGKDYKTKADYDEAVMRAAEELGIAVTEEQDDGVDAYMNPKKKIVRRPISEVAAEVNRKSKQKKSNPMGSSQSNKKKNPMS